MTSTSIYSASIPATQSNTEIFISKAKLVHGELYNYDSVEYILSKLKVKIECKLHGIFEQTPSNHLQGDTCIKCSRILIKQKLSSNNETFINKANIIHGDLYNYDFVNYINNYTKVKIECKIHGIFEQTPTIHLRVNGCPSCKHTISKISTKWLESLDISDLIKEYRLPENKRKAVDGYSPLTNTVYQFHGDYWHGNPLKYNSEDINTSNNKTYGTLYEKTIESDLWILSLGYNLVTMWESSLNIMVNHIS